MVGMPDEVLGEAVRAFVVPRSFRDAGLGHDLKRFCEKRLPAEFVPREIVLSRALPKNSAGKILKQKLKSMPLSPATGSANRGIAPPVHELADYTDCPSVSPPGDCANRGSL